MAISTHVATSCADVPYLTQQLVNGLSLGSVYGLIAIGYTMVYGIIGMINFAHGEIYMIGAFISLLFFMLIGVGELTGVYVPLAIFLALIVTMVFTSFYGFTLERVAYKPLRSSPRLAALITAIGMSIFLQNFVQLSQGARTRPMQPLIKGGIELIERADGFIAQISFIQIIIILTTVTLMVIFTTIIQKTSLGRAQRACEQDRKMAALVGIDVNKTISITFIMGASLASVAGMLNLLNYGVIDFYIGFLAGLKAFTAAVLGGIGSLPGAMLGGLLIGLIEAFWSGCFTSEYKDVAVFSILVLVLIFKPTGFLGRPEIEKV